LRDNAAIDKAESERAAVELAGSLAEAFESEDPTKVKIDSLKNTEARLLNIVKSSYRKNYVKGTLWAFLVVAAVLGLIMYYFPNEVKTPPETWNHINPVEVGKYAAYCLFGAMGALLSVAMGIRNIDFDVNLRGWEHFFSGLTRISIGIFAGIIIGLAVQSKFLNPSFNSETSAPVLYFLAFIAGFSESMVPNLLRRGESAADPSTDNGTKKPNEEPGG
jgi:hypothetical protein